MLREVEKRVEAMRQTKDTADDQAKLKNRPLFTMDRPANGLPEDLREHTRLMCDIIAIAFQTDKTRIATLILARDLKAKVDSLGKDRPSPIMQREAAVIEFLAKDIKEKMKLTVNPD